LGGRREKLAMAWRKPFEKKKREIKLKDARTGKTGKKKHLIRQQDHKKIRMVIS